MMKLLLEIFKFKKFFRQLIHIISLPSCSTARPWKPPSPTSCSPPTSSCPRSSPIWKEGGNPRPRTQQRRSQQKRAFPSPNRTTIRRSARTPCDSRYFPLLAAPRGAGPPIRRCRAADQMGGVLNLNKCSERWVQACGRASRACCGSSRPKKFVVQSSYVVVGGVVPAYVGVGGRAAGVEKGL